MKMQILQQNFQSADTASSGERGTALLILLFFAAVISFAAGNIAFTARNQTHLSRIIIDRTAAQQVAEGGASRAIGYIGENPDQFDPEQPELPFKEGTLGNGKYSVDIKPRGDNYFTIISTGTAGDQSRTVKIHARLPLGTEAMQYAMFTKGTITIHGTGDVLAGAGDGSIYAGVNVDLRGNVTIEGNVLASDFIFTTGGAFEIHGEQIPNAPNVVFPTLEDYRKEAKIHEGDLIMNNYNGEPDGGVLWVDGDIELGGSSSFSGTLIATGDIVTRGNYDHDQVGNKPALISTDGNIESRGTGEINGLIIAEKGRVEMKGDTYLNGAVVAWDGIIADGNFGMVNFVEQKPEMEGDNLIELLAWEM